MSGPGFRHLRFGLAWIAAGLVLSVIAYSFLPGGWYLFAVGLALVGLIQVLVGVMQYISYRLKSPEDKALHHARIEQRALVRAMVAMAAADGKLLDSEIDTISGIYHRLTGHSLERALIIKVAKTVRAREYSLSEDLSLNQSQISDQMKENIIRAAYLVMVADGEIVESEKDRISELAATLHIAHDHAVKIVEELRLTDPDAKN